MSKSMTKRDSILFVGLSCLDIINVCNGYPEEDTDQRSISQCWQSGGNASNNCSVFMQLLKWHQSSQNQKQIENKVEYLGTMSADFAAMFLREDFRKNGIITNNVVIHEQSSCPSSSVIINVKNGSRTIIHFNKDLPELTLDSFSKLDLNKYKLIHFEGRNNKDIKKMIDHIRQTDTEREIKISIELEKSRDPLIDLLQVDCDIFFIEKEFSSQFNCYNSEQTIEVISPKVHSTATVICPWAESGAKAVDKINNQVYSSPAFKPKAGVIDTLGAGDTFISATLFAIIILKYKLQDSIVFGCRVAGAKCGSHGFTTLYNFHQLIDN